jgi:hypothetical protein
VAERFANVNFVNRVPHGGSGVMVWAGISYRQRTQLHIIDGNLNKHPKYRAEILKLSWKNSVSHISQILEHVSSNRLSLALNKSRAGS